VTATDSVNDFLMGGGAASAKFPTVGTIVKGKITASEVTQQTDFSTGKPKFYDDGKPMNQIVVTLATDERDSSVEDDDGSRKLYVRGQMLAAVRDAVKETGSKLDIGGTLAVQYIEDKPSSKGFPQKIYKAQYKAPDPTAASNDLLGGSEPAAQQQPAPSDLI
jgi:hypothetical protein